VGGGGGKKTRRGGSIPIPIWLLGFLVPGKKKECKKKIKRKHAKRDDHLGHTKGRGEEKGCVVETPRKGKWLQWGIEAGKETVGVR